MDLDGTLEDSRQDMSECVNTARVQYDLPEMAPTAIEPNVMKGMEHLYRSCFPELFPGGSANKGSSEENVMAEVKKAYEADYKRYVAHHTVAYFGIKECLPKLAELGPIAIYTNKPEHISRKLLIELGLSRYFAFIIGCETFTETKPSAKPMEVIAGDADFERGKDLCFVIGDSAGDMQAAKNFDAVSIWCKWGYYEEPPNPAPQFIANRPEDLPGLVGDYAKEHGQPV